MTVGSVWSFSDILSGDGILLETSEATAIFRLPESAEAGEPNRRLILVSGGTTIADLNDWLLVNRLSLITSGAHNGQTVAGMWGTGTHGSVVDWGAFQNHVRGIHLITGARSSVWVERGPAPVLDDRFVSRFASRIERSADLFDACLVHLGGMGILNALLLEVAEDYRVAVVRRKQPMTSVLFDLLQSGDFGSFADEVWPEAGPQYRVVS